MARKEEKYFSFKRARNIVRALSLPYPQDFFTLRKANKLPKGVPPYPNKEYLYDGWQDWDDFLGKPPRIIKRRGPRALYPRTPKVKRVSFQKARKYARSLKLDSAQAWFEHCREGHLPPGFSARPGSSYPQEWDGWVDFLGLTVWERKLKKYQ